MLHVTAIGNLGRDAQIKHTDQNGVFATFPLAATTYVRGEYLTTWIDCIIIGKRAESLVGRLTKGAKVAAVGQSHMRRTEKGSYLQLRIDEITLLDRKEKEGSDVVPF